MITLPLPPHPLIGCYSSNNLTLTFSCNPEPGRVSSVCSRRKPPLFPKSRLILCTFPSSAPQKVHELSSFTPPPLVSKYTFRNCFHDRMSPPPPFWSLSGYILPSSLFSSMCVKLSPGQAERYRPAHLAMCSAHEVVFSPSPITCLRDEPVSHRPSPYCIPSPQPPSPRRPITTLILFFSREAWLLLFCVPSLGIFWYKSWSNSAALFF